jgi:hypothetical protein
MLTCSILHNVDVFTLHTLLSKNVSLQQDQDASGVGRCCKEERRSCGQNGPGLLCCHCDKKWVPPQHCYNTMVENREIFLETLSCRCAILL